MSNKPRLLIVADTYEPGWKAGGPVQSLKNLAALLSDSFDIFVLTRNHDHLESEAYPDVESDVWTEREDVSVYYASMDVPSRSVLVRLISDVQPDVLYLTGIMSSLTRRVLFLCKTSSLRSRRVVLAPQGQLSGSAIANKPLRKHAYLTVAQISGAFSNVTWHASSDHEASDIRRAINGATRIEVIPDAVREPSGWRPPHTKTDGRASFVAVSRVSPIKNVHWMVKLFEHVQGSVVLRLVGPREPSYWRQVSKAVERLPPNISFEYLGSVHPSEIRDILLDSDFFLSATLSENFGHAIFDSLSNGVPVLISDRTPWSWVATADAGWVLSASAADGWIETLNMCVTMLDSSYADHSRAALDASRAWYRRQVYFRRYKDLLGS